jgi:predicted dehydrogenase
MEDVVVAGVAARRPEGSAALASTLGVPSSSVRGILDDPSIEAVDVTVPTSRHAEIVEASLDAGKHVFCETPLAHDAASAGRMTDRARERGRLLQVALLHRFAQQSLFVRRAVLDGALGATRAVTTRRLAPGTGGEHHGDAFEELMLFDLDFLLWTFGEPGPVHASAFRDGTGRIQHAFATLEFGAVRAMAEATFLLPRSHPFTTSVFAVCERGAVEAGFRSPRAGTPRSRCALYPADGDAEVSDEPGQDPYFAECRRFADVVHGVADPGLLDGMNAVAALRVLDRLRAAAS